MIINKLKCINLIEIVFHNLKAETCFAKLLLHRYLYTITYQKTSELLFILYTPTIFKSSHTYYKGKN